MISIVIPVYNVEKYLVDCLDSIINQNFSDWEVIMVNDGSTDHSDEIGKEYCEKDKRFRIMNKAIEAFQQLEIKALSYVRENMCSSWMQMTQYCTTLYRTCTM